MKIGLISDTHGKLRGSVFTAFDGVEAILHAGDVGDPQILQELGAIAPVHAVFGNTDGPDVRAVTAESLSLVFDERRIVVVHGHLLASLAPARLRDAYPDADVVMHGHTHVALVDDAGAPLVVNPGAAGPARFRLKPSVAILDTTALQVELVAVE
jgi:putative phosphoesterase